MLAVYTKEDQDPIKWSEQHLYGSSRVGMVNLNMKVPANISWPTPGNTMQDGFDYGKTVYELSNHLGNVLATITDQKDAVQNGSTGLVGYYKAVSMTQTDYYPFGMQMVGRTYRLLNGYRYGFNGMENDDEVKGEGNSIDFGARIYDSRIGRWLSVDPLQKLIPGLTPYNYVFNSPLKFVDPDGQLGIVVHLKKDTDGNYQIISIEFSDDLLYKKSQYYKNHSLVYEHEWRDYLKIVIENSDGSQTSEIIPGSVRTTTNYLPNIKWIAQEFVDDGYFNDGGGVMFTVSDGGSIGGTRKTSRSVKSVNIDGFGEALSASIKGIRMPKVDKQFLFELNKKIAAVVKAFSDKDPLDNVNTSDESYKQLMKELNSFIQEHSTNSNNSNNKSDPKTPAKIPVLVEIDRTIFTKNGYKYPTEGGLGGGTISETKDSNNRKNDTTYRVKTIYKKKG